MKTLPIYTVMAATALVLTSMAPARFHTDTYKLDPKLSTIGWHAAKMTGKHNGTISFTTGEISNAHGTITGSVEVDMTTIKNTDVESAEYKAKLENHLKSADFFDVAKYPK